MIKEIRSRHNYSRNKAIGLDHSDLKMVRDISASNDAIIHQIWDSSLKQDMRYAPDMIILETRSRSQ